MKRKLEKSFHKTINGLDIFAKEVRLNFKKRPQFTTTMGGILSIFVSVIFLLYFQTKVSLLNTHRGNTYQQIKSPVSVAQWEELGNVTLQDTKVDFWMQLRDNQNNLLEYNETVMQYLSIYQIRKEKNLP